MSRKKDRGYGEHAQRRNAHAVAARARKAGPHDQHVGDNKDCEYGHPDCDCLVASRGAKASGLLPTGHCKACK